MMIKKYYFNAKISKTIMDGRAVSINCFERAAGREFKTVHVINHKYKVKMQIKNLRGKKAFKFLIDMTLERGSIVP